jgi:hypothetical protein
MAQNIPQTISKFLLVKQTFSWYFIEKDYFEVRIKGAAYGTVRNPRQWCLYNNWNIIR